jgi:hypothetical protein
MRFPSRRRFEKWLSDAPLSSIVGIARSHCDCPIARFLSICGAPFPYVRPHHLARNSWWCSTDEGTDRGRLPIWANQFARIVDSEIQDGEVSRDQALLILSRTTAP